MIPVAMLAEHWFGWMVAAIFVLNFAYMAGKRSRS